jgi:hypothetical protein
LKRHQTSTISFNQINFVSAGLPDGLFSNQKSKFGQILEGSELKMLVYFMTIWNILFKNMVIFGIVWGHLVYLSNFGTFGPKKNLATLRLNSNFFFLLFLAKVATCRLDPFHKTHRFHRSV